MSAMRAQAADTVCALFEDDPSVAVVLAEISVDRFAPAASPRSMASSTSVLVGVSISCRSMAPPFGREGRILARAREGAFGRRALRQVPVPALVDRYLSVSGDTVRVRPDILAAVDYRRVNLMDGEQVASLGVFDVILCRNVLIYFREERMRELLQRLAAALAPEGVLFVGASESLLRFGTSFLCEERSGVFFYRKSP